MDSDDRRKRNCSARSAIGDTRALAQHIRGEVVAGLPLEEANQIIIRSAQAARAGALLAVRRLYGPNPDEERTRLTEWCQHSAEPSVQDFVNAHDQHHDQLDVLSKMPRNLVDRLVLKG